MLTFIIELIDFYSADLFSFFGLRGCLVLVSGPLISVMLPVMLLLHLCLHLYLTSEECGSAHHQQRLSRHAHIPSILPADHWDQSLPYRSEKQFHNYDRLLASESDFPE